MPGTDESTCRVTFLPEGVTAEVPKGSTVIEACHAANVAMDAVCGGTGKCGRCKVRPRGPFRFDGQSKLSEEDRASGTTLACETFVEGDLEVEILPRSRIRKHQILERSADRDIPTMTPWLRKILVEMPRATIFDNTADLERLLRTIAEPGLTMDMETLRRVPHVLRDGDWKVTATISELGPPGEIVRLEPGDRRGSLIGLAVDIGTTTVVAQAVDLLTGEVLATASEYNRQISRGEDVIARMMYGEEMGFGELTELARQTVDSIVQKLIDDVSARRGEALTENDIVGASVAGNTIMTHFFVGLDTRYLRLEPYVPVAHNVPPRRGHDLGIHVHPSARTLLFPSRAGYLGGDVVADVVASGMHVRKEPTLLIDVGTNGEMVLGCADWLVACACSAGPAFEGGEVSSGMRAMDGAIESIRLNDDLSTAYHVLGDEAPNGICGSGLIDLIAEMYAHGVIDRKARIQDLETDRIREDISGREYVVEWKDRLGQGAAEDLVVTDADLQNILRTKAAIYGAATVLLNKMSQQIDGLDEVVIAGGFGNHLDIDRAISIGMFPDKRRDKYRFIGNGALSGARLALLSADMRKEMAEVFEEMTYIELSVDNDFYNEFSSSLFIPHTDISKFPSFTERRGLEDAG